MSKSLRSSLAMVLLLALTLAAAGCQSAYYGALEQLGVQKRDVLVDRVEKGRDAQHEAQEQFSSALEQFRAVVQVPESKLSETYDRLQAEYDDSEAAAARVTSRIEAIEDVAGALFSEWEDELSLYQSDEYRRLSERQLRQTRQRYAQMIAAMRDAADSMQPVLLALRDNTLFLKHNLNARAIGALRGEVDGLEREIEALRQRMQDAIARSDAFIAELNRQDEP